MRGQFLDVLEAVKKGAGHHDHARPAAVRLVIDFVILIGREVADVRDGDRDDPLLLALA